MNFKIVLSIFIVLSIVNPNWVQAKPPKGSHPVEGALILEDGSYILPKKLLLNGNLSYGKKLICRLPDRKNKLKYFPFKNIRKIVVRSISKEKVFKSVERFVYADIELTNGKTYYVKTDFRRFSYSCTDCPSYNGVTYVVDHAGRDTIQRQSIDNIKAVELFN